MSVTVILAEMEELAPTPKEVICADARKDGQAMIVTKTCLDHVTVILAIMEQLASTLREVIPAFAKEDGKAMIVTQLLITAYPIHVLLENAG